MSPNEQAPNFEMATVLFLDIVGYSLRSIDEETELLTVLQQAVRETSEYQAASANKELISLPTGDGMALVFLRDPMCPVRCAIEIATSLRTHREFKVRMGLNTGPVRRHADIKEEINIVGGGINIAQRVMDCGDGGHILLSHSIAEVLQQARGWKRSLQDLGMQEVKHGVKVHLYNLVRDGCGNPAVPQKISASQTKDRRKRLGWMATGAIVLATAAAGAIWYPKTDRSDLQSIAVLPFEAASQESSLQSWSDGFSEDLFYELMRSPGLHVAGTRSSFKFRGKNLDTHAIGHKLHVATILMGNVSREGNRLKIRVALMKTQDDFSIWAHSFDSELNDIVMVRDQIAQSVRQALGARVPEEKKAAVNGPAYNAFVQGSYFLQRPNQGDIERALGYFEQAVKIDPGYASAWGGLAYALENLAGGSASWPVKNAYDRARNAAERALALDPNLAMAHGALGYIMMAYDWDWEGARVSFERELSLEPNNPYALAHVAYLDLILHRLDNGIANYEKSVDSDPLNPAANRDYGFLLHYAGKQREAENKVQKALELAPEFANAHSLLTRIYLAESRPRDALAEAEKENYKPFLLYGLALAHFALGHKQEADDNFSKLIDIAKTDGPFQIAEVAAFRGEKDLAFHWLNEAYKLHDAGLLFLAGDPLLKNLEDDPRLVALATKMKLPYPATTQSHGS